MNAREPPRKVYKNNKIQKLALPSLQSKDVKDGQNCSQQNSTKVAINQNHSNKKGSANSKPKKKENVIIPRLLNKNHRNQRIIETVTTSPGYPYREPKNRLVREGDKNFKIILSSNEIRQQGIFGVRREPQYVQRKRRNSPRLVSVATEQQLNTTVVKVEPVYEDPPTTQSNEYKWLNGFSCTVGIQSKKVQDSEIDVDDDFLQGFTSALSVTFEEIIEEYLPFKTGTKSLLIERLGFYARKEADEESEADDTSGTYLTECPQSSSWLPQGSQDRASSRFDPRHPPNSLGAELSTSTLSTTYRPHRAVTSPNWKPLQSQPVIERSHVLGDLGPYPVFQPKQSRPKQISVFPKFGKKYHVPDPEIHDCKKKLQRGSSFEYLPRSKYDPNRQFNYIKSEPREMDQNTISKISYHPPMPQNRGDSGIYFSGGGSQTCVHCHPARCASVAPSWMPPNYVCSGHVSTFYPTVHPPPPGPSYQLERIDALPRASFYPAGPSMNPQNYPVIYYQPFHAAPPQ